MYPSLDGHMTATTQKKLLIDVDVNVIPLVLSQNGYNDEDENENNNKYVLARTYTSWLGHVCAGRVIKSWPRHVCPGQDIHMSWPRHVCPGQDMRALAKTYRETKIKHKFQISKARRNEQPIRDETIPIRHKIFENLRNRLYHDPRRFS